MFLRRLALMALMMLLRMEQQAAAEAYVSSGFIYCCGNSNNSTTALLYTDAFQSHSWKNKGDGSISGSLCGGNICFNSVASEKILKEKKPCGTSPSWGSGFLLVKSTCTKSTIGNSSTTNNSNCAVYFDTTTGTCCESGQYKGSTTCLDCPKKDNKTPSSSGNGGQASCYYPSTTYFSDAKGSYHFKSSCYYLLSS